MEHSDEILDLLIEEDLYYEPLANSVTEKLRNLILDEKLPNNLPLREESLAKKFRVSRGPIREAMKQLSIEGLVEIIPRRGAFVHWISKKDLEELVLIRVGLERASLKLAMTRNFDALVADLKDNLKLIEENVSNNNWQGVLDAEVKFHDLIYEHSQSQRISTLWLQIRPQVVVSIRNDRAFISNPETVLISHKKLYETIKSSNIEEAIKELKVHIQPVSRLGDGEY